MTAGRTNQAFQANGTNRERSKRRRYAERNPAVALSSFLGSVYTPLVYVHTRIRTTLCTVSSRDSRSSRLLAIVRRSPIIFKPARFEPSTLLARAQRWFVHDEGVDPRRVAAANLIDAEGGACRAKGALIAGATANHSPRFTASGHFRPSMIRRILPLLLLLFLLRRVLVLLPSSVARLPVARRNRGYARAKPVRTE